MKNKMKTWKIILIGIGVVVASSLLFLSTYGYYGWFKYFKGESNIGTMRDVCNRIGVDSYIYKVGWSDTCGFDVYRGTCVSHGMVVGNVDYLLVDGNLFTFEYIESDFPSEELKRIDKEFDAFLGTEKHNEEVKKVLKEYKENACNKLGKYR